MSSCFFFLYVEGYHGAPSSLLLVNHVNWPQSRISKKAIKLLIVRPPKVIAFGLCAIMMR